MTDRQKVIGLLKQCLEDWPYAAIRVTTIMHRIQDAMAILEKQEAEAQCEDEATSDMRDYCERYEPTYNPEDGSM